MLTHRLWEAFSWRIQVSPASLVQEALCCVAGHMGLSALINSLCLRLLEAQLMCLYSWAAAPEVRIPGISRGAEGEF